MYEDTYLFLWLCLVANRKVGNAELHARSPSPVPEAPHQNIQHSSLRNELPRRF